MTLDPAVAAVRNAVREDLSLLHDGGGGRWSPLLADGAAVLVACSGGADSLALLAGTVFEARNAPFTVVGVTVDHGLQPSSTEHAAHVVAQMAELGADETVSVRVSVSARGQGPEAAAREARYAVLEEVAQRWGAPVVLLGHTLDDQAETVLLGLTRGSGGRSIAGMRRSFDVFRRPLLDLTRAQTEQACRAQRIEWWEDPHNGDPRFTRARVRHRVLPLLEEELGPGVAATLARTADQLRLDMAALDDLADRALEEVRADHDHPEQGLRTLPLESMDQAISFRVLRRAALEAGALASDLTYRHVLAVSDLLIGPAGDAARKQVQLPGRITAYREGNLLKFRPTAVPG